MQYCLRVPSRAGAMFSGLAKVRSPEEYELRKAAAETPATIPFVAPQPTAPQAKLEDDAEPISADADGRSIRINPPAALSLHNPEGLAVSDRRGFSLPDVTLQGIGRVPVRTARQEGKSRSNDSGESVRRVRPECQGCRDRYRSGGDSVRAGAGTRFAPEQSDGFGR
ncbi:MAG: hypothetical protein U0936_04670 [Planctomycetaceae bacterium]